MVGVVQASMGVLAHTPPILVAYVGGRERGREYFEEGLRSSMCHCHCIQPSFLLPVLTDASVFWWLTALEPLLYLPMPLCLQWCCVPCATIQALPPGTCCFCWQNVHVRVSNAEARGTDWAVVVGPKISWDNEFFQAMLGYIAHGWQEGLVRSGMIQWSMALVDQLDWLPEDPSKRNSSSKTCSAEQLMGWLVLSSSCPYWASYDDTEKSQQRFTICNFMATLSLLLSRAWW